MVGAAVDGVASAPSSDAAGSVVSGMGEGSVDSVEPGVDSVEVESVGVAWEPETAEASDGAWEVVGPVAGSSPPQAVANITITKPMTPALSHEGWVDMARSLNLGGNL